MRRSSLCILLALLSAVSLSAEGRLDLGVIVPRGAGMTAGGETQLVGDFDVANWPFIPLPEAGIYFEGGEETVKFGFGARAFTFIVATILWPNAFVEVNFDRLVVEAQVGGGAFALLSIGGTNADFGAVAIPDISAWYKLGKNRNFRLGGGLIGLYLPELIGDGLPFLIYLGGKATIPL